MIVTHILTYKSADEPAHIPIHYDVFLKMGGLHAEDRNSEGYFEFGGSVRNRLKSEQQKNNHNYFMKFLNQNYGVLMKNTSIRPVWELQGTKTQVLSYWSF